MIDKVKKIREEVERIQLYTQSEVLKQILDYIDKVQEEPVSNDFELALANEWKDYVDRGTATVDALEDNTQELAFSKGFYRGAKWKEFRHGKELLYVSNKTAERTKREVINKTCELLSKSLPILVGYYDGESFKNTSDKSDFIIYLCEALEKE